MSFKQDLDVHLRARSTLIAVVTPEEDRFLDAIRELCEASRLRLVLWDIAEGFEGTPPCPGQGPLPRDPISALEQADRLGEDAVFVLKDFHEYWGQHQVRRKLRNLAARFRLTRKSLIILCPEGRAPLELREHVVVLEVGPPGPAELMAEVDLLAAVPGLKVDLTPLGRDRLVEAALGMSGGQFRRALATAIVENAALDHRAGERIAAERAELVRQSEAIEFLPPGCIEVGGLDGFKEWLARRQGAFSGEARRYGLPRPRGVALVGPPGSGKSLAAKMIGGQLGIPTLKLDLGALYGGLVGESEAATRRALRLAELASPCVLLVDEADKAFDQGGLDGGTSSRVFGTILTWLQERTAPCFVVLTGNDPAAMPPELLRKGRLDDVFFVDLPSLEERIEVFCLHLGKRGRPPQAFDLDLLGQAADGYVGAEIEQAVIEAMYVGWSLRREFTTDDVLEALAQQVPQSVTYREKLDKLRAMLSDGRVRSASGGDRWHLRQGAGARQGPTRGNWPDRS